MGDASLLSLQLVMPEGPSHPALSQVIGLCLGTKDPVGPCCVLLCGSVDRFLTHPSQCGRYVPSSPVLVARISTDCSGVAKARRLHLCLLSRIVAAESGLPC